MNNKTRFLVSFLIIIVNRSLGSFFTSIDVLLSPVALISIAILFRDNEQNSILKSGILTFLLSVHNYNIAPQLLVIDYEDVSQWIYVLPYLSIILAYFIFIKGTLKNNHETKNGKIVSIILFPILLIWFHLLPYMDFEDNRIEDPYEKVRTGQAR